MKTLSITKMAKAVKTKRKEMGLKQEELSQMTDINRALISRIERENFVPSILQLEKLAHVLQFDMEDLMVNKPSNNSFMALRSEELSENEKEGVEKLITMMLSLRQQILLRSKFENEQH